MTENDQAVILAGSRTPVGKFQGGLASLSAPELGAIAVREAVARAGLEAAQVSEVILGNVLAAGLGQNPARQAALRAGLPPAVAALTINKVCGSGLKAVMLAAQAVLLGDAEVVAAGGQESMSNAPYLLPKARTGLRMGHGELVDSMIQDGLWCPFCDWHMGSSAEHVASTYHVGRAAQDREKDGSDHAVNGVLSHRFHGAAHDLLLIQAVGVPAHDPGQVLSGRCNVSGFQGILHPPRFQAQVFGGKTEVEDQDFRGSG